MRQIQNLPSTPGCRNASTCGFSERKGRCARGSGICRILPSGDSRSAVKNRALSTRPRFWASATCGFVGKNRSVLGGFRFFPALPENAASIVRSNIKRPSATTGCYRGNIKGPLPETEQRPFFVIASRRVRDDCITENILP